MNETPEKPALGAAVLAAAGEALFGKQWQSDIARELGLKDARRVRQWMTGDRPIPPGIWNDLEDLLRQRGQRAIELADQLHALRAP